jgi:hypothetical protein
MRIKVSLFIFLMMMMVMKVSLLAGVRDSVVEALTLDLVTLRIVLNLLVTASTLHWVPICIQFDVVVRMFALYEVPVGIILMVAMFVNRVTIFIQLMMMVVVMMMVHLVRLDILLIPRLIPRLTTLGISTLAQHTLAYHAGIAVLTQTLFL